MESTPRVGNQPKINGDFVPRGRVTFEDVTFSYDREGCDPVLKGINFCAEPGQTVAILGATGSGKSSLIAEMIAAMAQGGLFCDMVVKQVPFILFDLEVVFFYPWAVLFRKLKLFGLIEMGIFILILLVGYIYVWKKGALEWE